MKGSVAADRWFHCGQGFQIHRRYEQPKRREEPSEPEDVLETDAVEIFDKEPQNRLKWLEDAMIRMARGKLKTSVVFEVIEQPKFILEMDDSMGAQAHALLLANSHLFSSQQQKGFAASTFPLAKFPRSSASSAMGEPRMASAVGTRERNERRRDTVGDDDRSERRTIADERSDDRDRARRRTERRRSDEDERRDDRCRERASRSDHGTEAPEKQETKVRRDEVDEEMNEMRRKRRKRLQDSLGNVEQVKDAGGWNASGFEVFEKKRGPNKEAELSATLLTKVLEQVRTVGLHAQQSWSARELSVCSQQFKMLQQKTLDEKKRAEFSTHLVNFEKKQESASAFLQFLLETFKGRPPAEEAEAIMFLGLLIIMLQNKQMRTALHERVLTVKKQLGEGSTSASKK